MLSFAEHKIRCIFVHKKQQMIKSKKAIVKSGIIALFSLLTVSCTDFLSSIRNENNQSIESLLYNINDLDVCINGAYGAFCAGGYYGNYYLCGILESDEATYTRNTAILPEFSLLNTSNYFFSYRCNIDDYQAGLALQWSSFVSNNCNVVIKSIEGGLPALKTRKDSLNANRLLGEAYLMRATVEYYNNFLIGRQYHATTINAPSTLYRRKPVMSFEDMAEPRKSVGEVYRFLVSDLQKAEKLLPVNFDKNTHSTAYQYRCKRDVATAMLAKVYFQKNDFDSALVYINSLLGNTKGASVKFPLQNGLTYSQLFRITDKVNFQAGSNSEIIMAFHGNNAFQPTTAVRWGAFQWTAFKNLQNNDLTSSNFRIVLDSSLIRNFLSGDTLFDVRYRQLIYRTKSAGKEAPAGQWTTLKFAYPTSNVLWMRAAEFHLMRAEIFIHKNELLNALSELNLIRTRAGLSEFIQPVTKVQVFLAVIQERSRELYFENIRRSDNLRLASLSDSPYADYLPEPYKSGYIPTGNRALFFNETKIAWNDDRLYCLLPENEYLYNPALKP